ncbi:MAG: hypothetical protein J5644_10595 [Bacteroidales bacterium]|nr:hypothetical protein [Bacteroidales bacterium]
MRILFSMMLLVFCLCPKCDAQEKEIYCIVLIDQSFPEYLHGKCFFGEDYKDSVETLYDMGHLRFIDTDKRLSKYLDSNTVQTNETQQKWIELCFDIDRLIGSRKVEKRRYCGSIPLIMFEENLKYPKSLFVCEIITLNKKKNKYLFYVRGNGYVSAIRDKKGKKIHWKMFPAANTPF